MAATVTGSKTVTQSQSPFFTAALLTSLLATAIENLTVGQLHELDKVMSKVPGGDNPKKVIGALLP